MSRHICQGCGSDMGCYDSYPATEAWHEFCGDCNREYYRRQAEMEEQERNEKLARSAEKWNSLVTLYGHDLACEMMADS